MNTSNYSTLQIEYAQGVATVSINHPPVNVLDVALMSEIQQFLLQVRNDPLTRVIVFQSADPDFFIAHVDMTLIDEPNAFDEIAKDSPDGLNPFQALGEMIRRQPQVTIAKLEGLARGGGAEFVATMDKSFAAIGRAGLAQCEALMGIIPGGGATQYLSQRMTRGRVLEVILGAELVDAQLAERYGWVNRALPANELDAFVNRLANNIAALSEGVIAATKKAVSTVNLSEGLQSEHEAWADLFALPNAEKLIREGLKAGAQTKIGEKKLEQLLRDLSKSCTEF